jgi:SIR2-like domain
MPLQPPYGVIWNALKEGTVVPFLGAGASMIQTEAKEEAWNFDLPKRLPSGGELAQFLASETEFPAPEPSDMKNLAKVCSYYADISGRGRLRSRLRQALNHEFDFGVLHTLLAKQPTPLLIVLTNYDTFLERAFDKEGKPYDLVVYPADLKDNANAVQWWPYGAKEPQLSAPNALNFDIDEKLRTTSIIFKMHGTVAASSARWDHFVITEEDYIDFLSRMTANSAIPSIFYPYFHERSFLFLGYGLGDWNLRVVLKNLTRGMASWSGAAAADEIPPSWAIQRNPSLLEQTLWRKRNVEIFQMEIDEFVSRLMQHGNK